MHPGAWPAFLRRIIKKKNLDVQAFFTIGLKATEEFRRKEGNVKERGKPHYSQHQNPKIKPSTSLKCNKVLFLAFGMAQPSIQTLSRFC